MTNQVYTLPNLEPSTSRRGLLQLSKYSGKKQSSKPFLNVKDEEPLLPSPRQSIANSCCMDTQEASARTPKKSRRKVNRQESMIVEDGGDTTSLATVSPRLRKEDRSRSDTALLPPILPQVSNQVQNSQETPRELKLPSPSRYQLYSIPIGLATSRTSKGKRSRRKPELYGDLSSRKTKARKESREAVNVKSEQTDTLKFSENESSFSIRKKIEQYRNWHEDQYKQKLKELKQESEREKHSHDAKVILTLQKSNGSGKNRDKNGSRRHSYDQLLPKIALKLDTNFDSVPNEEDEDKKAESDMDEGVELLSPVAKAADITRKTERATSSRTWKTWRGVNDSYAYNDVKQYIKDNELMDDEKEKYITEWILKVNETSENSVLRK